MSAAVDFFTVPADLAPGAQGLRRLALVPSLTGESRIEPAARPGNSTLRLTFRGKVVAGLAVLAVGLGLLGIAHASAQPRSQSPTRGGIIAVQPGDTLWSIAERVAPASDPRNTVANLRALNQLASAELTPGQVLRVG